MLEPVSAELWNLPIYARLLDEVDPKTQRHLFRNRDQLFAGDNMFWATPSPEPDLPESIMAQLARPLDATHPIGTAAAALAQAIAERFRSDQLIFVAILRAGVPVADWLTQLLPGSKAVATSLFVGLGIDDYSFRAIRSHYPDRQVIFVDGWTGKGAVARVLQAMGAGPLAVLCDPWRAADFCGTHLDLLSPSAFFTGPSTLGFSRTFVQASDQPFAAYRFPRCLLRADVVRAWQRSCPLQPTGSATPAPQTKIFHETTLRLHSNEVCRALINSNPTQIMFADSAAVAREQFSLLVELADCQSVPVQFNVRDLQQFDARVACTLKGHS